MQQRGRVVAWEPPRRVVFDGGGAGGLASEWLVQASGEGTCVVRLVTSGFGSGEEWDDHQYDGMAEGWRIFLLDLGLHLQHFPGRCASSVLPFVQWSRPPGTARTDLLAALGIPENIEVGDRVEVDVGAGPSFGGMVADVAPRRLALVLDEPAPGTAFVTSEGRASADSATVSVWAYLYGPDAAVVAARTFPRWRCWLRELPDTAS